MHICKSSGNCTGKNKKKSISQNKEYHDNAKAKKVAVFRNKTFELRNRSRLLFTTFHGKLFQSCIPSDGVL